MYEHFYFYRGFAPLPVYQKFVFEICNLFWRSTKKIWNIDMFNVCINSDVNIKIMNYFLAAYETCWVKNVQRFITVKISIRQWTVPCLPQVWIYLVSQLPIIQYHHKRILTQVTLWSGSSHYSQGHLLGRSPIILSSKNTYDRTKLVWSIILIVHNFYLTLFHNIVA